MLLVQLTVGVVRDWTSQVRITVESKETLTNPGEMVTTEGGTIERERERERDIYRRTDYQYN